MGQHVTMHGKTVENFNDQPGKWVPIQVNASGQLNTALNTGELQQFNRQAGGPIVQHSAVISADAAIISGPCIFYGIKCLTNGTVTVYDSVTATGVTVISSEALVAGTFAYPAGPGVGVLMDAGIYLDLTLGTYIVYFAPGV